MFFLPLSIMANHSPFLQPSPSSPFSFNTVFAHGYQFNNEYILSFPKLHYNPLFISTGEPSMC